MENINLSEILSELIDEENITGCGFGDKNGLTLAVKGDMCKYVYLVPLYYRLIFFSAMTSHMELVWQHRMVAA